MKKKMMRSLGKYVRKKKLEVNVMKTKIMVFNKRKRKSEENEWKWEGKKIERMSKFKYLDYTFDERATDKVHMRNIVKKTNKVVGCVWGIWERKWMEGTREGWESARKIFEIGARSGQKKARLRSEGTVQEE
jgi:hypothetical protein